jgi:hypothetical protein
MGGSSSLTDSWQHRRSPNCDVGSTGRAPDQPRPRCQEHRQGTRTAPTTMSGAQAGHPTSPDRDVGSTGRAPDQPRPRCREHRQGTRPAPTAMSGAQAGHPTSPDHDVRSTGRAPDQPRPRCQEHRQGTRPAPTAMSGAQAGHPTSPDRDVRSSAPRAPTFVSDDGDAPGWPTWPRGPSGQVCVHHVTLWVQPRIHRPRWRHASPMVHQEGVGAWGGHHLSPRLRLLRKRSGLGRTR